MIIMGRTTKTNELKDILRDYQAKKESPDTDEIVNHWLRRFYRCFIDGSYLGYDHYLRLIERYKGIKKYEALYPRRFMVSVRSMAVSCFIDFLAMEFPMSRATIIKAVKDCFTREQLESLNDDLITDLIDYMDEQVQS